MMGKSSRFSLTVSLTSSNTVRSQEQYWDITATILPAYDPAICFLGRLRITWQIGKQKEGEVATSGEA
jgi:hypothetical protein